ncbi:MAG: flavin reductase family protein [Bacteroidota bacterium]
MICFDRDKLDGLARFYRGNLLNCATGVKPALLIGTKSKSGKSNLALFSSVFHLGADPALIGFVQRPLTDFSHTYKNIIETGLFTINHVSSFDSARAHATSAKFDEDESEFSACGFEEEYAGAFFAPFVKTSPLRLAMRFVRQIPIEENSTRIMIGAVEEIQVDESLLLDDGNIDPDRYSPLAVFGLETYLDSRVLARYAYAKPGVFPLPLT